MVDLRTNIGKITLKNPIMPASDQPTSLPDLPVESEHGTLFPSVDPSLMPATKPDGGSGSDDKPVERLTPKY